MTIALVIVVLAGLSWLACRALERQLGALTTMVEAMVPRATMRLLFVVATEDGLVIDGLLDVEDATVGVPTTWYLTAPTDPELRAIVSCLLQQWADDDAVVTVDLTRLGDPTPSLALDCDGSHVRLGITRRPSLSAG